MLKNYGFIEPKIAPEDYVFGVQTKLKAVVLQPDGQWDDYLPEVEFQYSGSFDTMNCTNYGTNNALETLFKRLYGQNVDWSERYTGVMTKTSPSGNSVENVIEVIRKTCGEIPEKELPFTKDITTWDKYYSPNPMSEEYLLLGQNFLTLYEIGHEWLWTSNIPNKPEILWNALKYCPPCVSVSAWYGQNAQGYYYKPSGAKDNHWVECYGGVYGKYWKIYDHYDASYKKLEWNYNFGFAKRYSIQKKTPTSQESIGFLKNALRILQIISDKIIELKDSIKGRLKGYWKQITQ